MTDKVLLTFNPGSSTVKLGLYTLEATGVRRLGGGMIDLRHTPLKLVIDDGTRTREVSLKSPLSEDVHEVIAETLDWISHHIPSGEIAGVGHRVVHGGDLFTGPVLITPEVEAGIAELIPLAPLHQPKAVRLIRAVRRLWPDLPQTASFDTAFHGQQTDLVRRFAIPRELFDEGIKRYGFHGLSYAYIAGALKRQAPELAEGRVVIAHLGSGASLCGIEGGISRDSSMGFSTLDGIPMATRCGALDPGVLLHLLEERGDSIETVDDMLYHRSGLLGVSGISADSRDLLESEAPAAAEAIDLFCFRIAQVTAQIAVTLGGLDGFVFTAGIGENQPEVRTKVMQHLAWLGASLDEAANAENAFSIHAPDSRLAVHVMATDEEQVIASEAFTLLADAAA
ncbi:acetate/propionate family kinase [Methyloligella sp. 2.7D]|uniref:acetate/propionate family kinase n=1 Tax=unclassified Methyloligella TaxID=2625955 RepID=UPI00157C6129|nr:acetate/propionate family kinase [Methyloligella sp. GL2]QKP76505.1 acetate/propionate family kinase [Methyloligella sp. GL2]